MIYRSLCPLCLCGSFHSLPQDCILEYILPTKPGRAEFLVYWLLGTDHLKYD